MKGGWGGPPTASETKSPFLRLQRTSSQLWYWLCAACWLYILFFPFYRQSNEMLNNVNRKGQPSWWRIITIIKKKCSLINLGNLSFSLLEWIASHTLEVRLWEQSAEEVEIGETIERKIWRRKEREKDTFVSYLLSPQWSAFSVRTPRQATIHRII